MEAMTFNQAYELAIKKFKDDPKNSDTHYLNELAFIMQSAAYIFAKSLAAKVWDDACYAQIDMIIDNQLQEHPWRLKQNIKNSIRPKNPYKNETTQP